LIRPKGSEGELSKGDFPKIKAPEKFRKTGHRSIKTNLLPWSPALRQTFGAMVVVSIRSRLMIAALVFALAWALGFAVHHAVHMSLAVLCLAIGSVALSYLVWEYHRAWRLRPSNAGSTAALGLRSWPGISVDGLIVRPEYITAALAFLLCVLGMILYFEASSRPPVPVSESRPSSLLPEAKPLE
jgi:hypothetical protein